MSQFSISQRGYFSLQQELDSVGDDYDQLCRLIIQFQITPQKWPRTPDEAISLIRTHIEKVSRSFYNVKDQMVNLSGLNDKIYDGGSCKTKWQRFVIKCTFKFVLKINIHPAF